MNIPTPGELRNAISDTDKREVERISKVLAKLLSGEFAQERAAILEWDRVSDAISFTLRNLFAAKGWKLTAENKFRKWRTVNTSRCYTLFTITAAK